MILARLSGTDPADMAAARAWAVANGISDGTNPGSAVTRQQLVALLYRYAQMMGSDNGQRADLAGFPDAGTVSAYAVEPMQWSVANGIVAGTSQGHPESRRHRHPGPVRGDPLSLREPGGLTAGTDPLSTKHSQAEIFSAWLRFRGGSRRSRPGRGYASVQPWLSVWSLTMRA